MVVMIQTTDGKTYTQYLNVSPATRRDDNSPYAPFDVSNRYYLPDIYTGPAAPGNCYQGGWFDPTTQYLDTTTGVVQSPPPSTAVWKAVMLYRPFEGLAKTTPFRNDPYEFALTAPNIMDSSGTNSLGNIGGIVFNPLAAGGNGVSALKAKISYLTYSWKIVHEDRDIPALTGTDTTAARLTLKNLKRAGDNNPDNSIYTGLIPNSFLSMIALDLDTGMTVGNGGPVFDPTTGAEGKINDEDQNGTNADPSYINVSFSTGRVTFGAQVFGDNINGVPAKAHRIRLFYVGDADWTVAVQKAPSYYIQNLTPVVSGTDPQLVSGQYGVESNANGVINLYFPRSDAGKSVEIDGTYIDNTGTAPHLKTLAATIAIPPAVFTLGATSYVRVNLGDSTLTGGLPPLPTGAPAYTGVTVTAVRGLSVRSVVAWKERDRFKVHSVDTLLNRAQ